MVVHMARERQGQARCPEQRRMSQCLAVHACTSQRQSDQKTAEERQLRLQRLSAIQWEKLATEHEHTWLMLYVLLPQFIQLAQARPMMQCTCLVVMLVWHKDHHCMTPPCTHNHVF